MLTSSRDYLQVAGETTYHVPTLSVPKKQVPLEALAQHEAVRLFVDRAAASMRGFGLTEQNAAAVADICYCLDGIPLAIELAAARVRALSVQTIAARLSDRFRLLVTGDQTVLPRQRTLRALIDWSYDLLTEHERTLFQRLSVFAGGWTLEAAEAVCADDDLRARRRAGSADASGREVASGDARSAESAIGCWTRFGITRRRSWLNPAMRVAVRAQASRLLLGACGEGAASNSAARTGSLAGSARPERENLLSAHAWMRPA